jgi:hypothetical protein
MVLPILGGIAPQSIEVAFAIQKMVHSLNKSSGRKNPYLRLNYRQEKRTAEL